MILDSGSSALHIVIEREVSDVITIERRVDAQGGKIGSSGESHDDLRGFIDNERERSSGRENETERLKSVGLQKEMISVWSAVAASFSRYSAVFLLGSFSSRDLSAERRN